MPKTKKTKAPSKAKASSKSKTAKLASASCQPSASRTSAGGEVETSTRAGLKSKVTKPPPPKPLGRTRAQTNVANKLIDKKYRLQLLGVNPELVEHIPEPPSYFDQQQAEDYWEYWRDMPDCCIQNSFCPIHEEPFTSDDNDDFGDDEAEGLEYRVGIDKDKASE